MKIILDAALSGKVQAALDEAGYDSEWVGAWTQAPSDVELLTRAFRESRIIVTLDPHFGDVAVVRGMEHTGIIRLVDQQHHTHSQLIFTLLEKYESELRSGATITLEGRTVRIRAADNGG